MRPRNKNICPDDVSMSLIRTLKTRRRSMKLTQKMLAANLGVTASAISSYESGKALPTLPVLMKLAVIFGADISSSVNWKYYHGEVSRNDLTRGMKRYGLTYSELGDILECDEGVVRKAVKFGHGSSLECLSKVLKILERENESEKFLRSLLRKTPNERIRRRKR